MAIGLTANRADAEDLVQDTVLREAVARSSIDDRIAAALAGLPERFRWPVELVDVAGLSYREAAEMLGVPIGTVMSRLHRARKRMRRHLDRVGFDVKGFDR